MVHFILNFISQFQTNFQDKNSLYFHLDLKNFFVFCSILKICVHFKNIGPCKQFLCLCIAVYFQLFIKYVYFSIHIGINSLCHCYSRVFTPALNPKIKRITCCEIETQKSVNQELSSSFLLSNIFSA